jgi:hypothetical protein
MGHGQLLKPLCALIHCLPCWGLASGLLLWASLEAGVEGHHTPEMGSGSKLNRVAQPEVPHQQVIQGNEEHRACEHAWEIRIDLSEPCQDSDNRQGPGTRQALAQSRHHGVKLLMQNKVLSLVPITQFWPLFMGKLNCYLLSEIWLISRPALLQPFFEQKCPLLSLTPGTIHHPCLHKVL